MKKVNITTLPFFNSLVKDYLNNDIKVRDLYSFPPTIEGLKDALNSKEKNYAYRNILVNLLDEQYADKNNLTEIEKEHCQILQTNGYAITTAHQPNLFLGPLYTITKAASAISLSIALNKSLGKKKIIPIYVIGSEDHDKEELLNVHLFGKKHEWNTEQTGAIGSMTVDESLLTIVQEWTDAFGNLSYSDELKSIFEEAYQKGNRIADATKFILRKIFSSYGLIILELKGKEVKEAMLPIFDRELKDKFAINTISSTVNFLDTQYSIQAYPRDYNLFEFKNGERIRIDEFDENIIERLHSKPENFSPNVILRPLMQQTILPSIANIGGGAEVSYWLELKKIFDATSIDFPAIILRDIISPLDRKSWERWQSFGLKENDFFLTTDELKKKMVLQDSNLETDFKNIEDATIAEFLKFYPQLELIDKTLLSSFEAEKTKLKKSIELLYSKAIKAEKRNQENRLNSAENIKNKVFENNILIERKENFSNYYLRYGRAWIDHLIQISNPIDAKWKLYLY